MQLRDMTCLAHCIWDLLVLSVFIKQMPARTFVLYTMVVNARLCQGRPWMRSKFPGACMCRCTACWDWTAKGFRSCESCFRDNQDAHFNTPCLGWQMTHDTMFAGWLLNGNFTSKVGERIGLAVGMFMQVELEPHEGKMCFLGSFSFSSNNLARIN